MKNKPNIVKIVLGIFTILIVTCVLFYMEHAGDNKQNQLLSKIQTIAAKNIVAIKIISGNEENIDQLKNIKSFKISEPHQIKSIKNLLKNSDKQRVGGHNRILYEVVLIFEDNMGYVEKYLCTAYSEYDYNRDALYISEYGIKRGFMNKPIRVPQLGKLIKKMCE
ncbi:MAG: hypothetical protein WA081_15965 [Desulfosalsimonadaceae bacterium]